MEETPERPSICLAMIVKDEAHCIAGCLQSVRDHISHWVICDTGSTDATRDVVRAELAGIPGELHDQPWVDFAHNRNAALQLAREHADYVLVIDADDELIADVPDPLAGLTAQAYWVQIDQDGTTYGRIQLVRSDLGCRFVGAVHEAVVVDGPHTSAVLAGCRIHSGANGARSRDPFKYLRDARLLEAELRADPSSARTAFYLAQSYRDAGKNEDALKAYQRRATMGGWDQELFFARYQVARLEHTLGRPWDRVLNSYLTAWQSRPSRLEPILHVARHYREQEEYDLGHLFARHLVETPFPTDVLFVERGVYEYELPLEYGICCYWTGRHQEAIRINEQILSRPGVPENFREAALGNRRFSLDALGEAV